MVTRKPPAWWRFGFLVPISLQLPCSRGLGTIILNHAKERVIQFLKMCESVDDVLSVPGRDLELPKNLSCLGTK